MKSFLAVLALTAVGTLPATADTIVDHWAEVTPPAPPQVLNVLVKPKTTAYLVLDMQTNICSAQVRPACVSAVPAMAAFLARARAAGMPVVYSNTPRASRSDIVAPLAPEASEPSVKASVDKFHGTDLDRILKAKGVDTVIVCGVTAFGAVLFTATAAAERGYKVILPVDCMPGGSPYEEQMTAYTVARGPGTARASKLTTLAGITFAYPGQ